MNDNFVISIASKLVHSNPLLFVFTSKVKC